MTRIEDVLTPVGNPWFGLGSETSWFKDKSKGPSLGSAVANVARRDEPAIVLLYVIEAKANRSRVRARDREKQNSESVGVVTTANVNVALAPARRDKLARLCNSSKMRDYMRLILDDEPTKLVDLFSPSLMAMVKWTAAANLEYGAEASAWTVLAQPDAWRDLLVDAWLPKLGFAHVRAIGHDAGPNSAAPHNDWCLELRTSLATEIESMASDAALAANAALNDACQLAELDQIRRPESWNMSEGGLLSLEWGGDTDGVLVVLSGEGEASFSVKSSARFYDAITDFRIGEGLPSQAAKALEDLPRS